MTDPIRPTDAEARELARDLLQNARSAALAFLTDQGDPMVTRIGFGLGPDGSAITLISDLSAHTKALRENPSCSLLVGDPGAKGDPLIHPRLTLQARARFVPNGSDERVHLAQSYLANHPKAKLYIDFADFSFAVFLVQSGFLNGGFGKAYVLTAGDMGLPI